MPRSSGFPFPTRQLRLAQGQSLFEKMPRGTVIRVAAGRAALVQRIYLDQATLVQHTVMARGAVHCVQVSDWLEVIAQSDAELVLLVPQPVSPQPLARALVAWFARVLPRWTARPASVDPRPETRGGATAAVAPPSGVCSLG
jgi:hypothetical protein